MRALSSVGKFLFSPYSGSFLRYCVSAYLLVYIGAFLLDAIVFGAYALAGRNMLDYVGAPRALDIEEFLVSGIAIPIFESFLLAVGLFLFAGITRNRVGLAAISALLWAILHAASRPASFFVAAWGFFVFSAAYMTWRQKSDDVVIGVLAAFVPHALANLTTLTILSVLLAW